MKTLQERFDAKYIPEPNSGCWLWTGATYVRGYGVIGTGEGKITEGAHRISWKLHCGEVPPGLHVLHKCDMPCCVNPDHLFLGTHRDNMQDMNKKGRRTMPAGEEWHRKRKKQ